MELPMDELWFNVLIRVIITIHNINGIGSFIAYIPGMSEDEAKILGYNTSHSFQLTTSLIFCLLGIAQFRYETLIYLTILEIIIIIVTYLHLMECKLTYLNNKKRKFKEVTQKRKEEIKTRLS